jgi:hypothetical protein
MSVFLRSVVLADTTGTARTLERLDRCGRITIGPFTSYSQAPGNPFYSMFAFICLFLALGVALAQQGGCHVGAPAATGDTVAVHYWGYIADNSATGVKGKLFDTSAKRKQSFTFKLGDGQVIRGWEQG